MVEALTQGLSGLGRKDTEKRWGGNVFLQVLDPDAFAGREAFLEQMDYLTERCQANAPLREGVPVRMPGEQAERSIAAAREQGVPLAEHTVQRLGGYGRAVRPRHAGRSVSYRRSGHPLPADGRAASSRR